MKRFKIKSLSDYDHSIQEFTVFRTIEASNLGHALIQYANEYSNPEKIDFRISKINGISCVEAFHVDEPNIILDWIIET